MARSISDEELQLKRRARRRLIGAIVLVTAIVVALPMVLDTEPKPISSDVSIRIPTPDSGGFTSRVVPVAPSGDTASEPAARPSTEKPAAKPSTEMKAPPKTADKPAPAPVSPTAKAPKPAETPAAPKSETAAVKESPAKADPPAAIPSAKAAGDPFVVQVIALADAEKAKQVQAQIAAAGLTSYTEVVKTVKGEVTRVRAGPFASRAAAEKAQEQLKAVGLPGNVVPK